MHFFTAWPCRKGLAGFGLAGLGLVVLGIPELEPDGLNVTAVPLTSWVWPAVAFVWAGSIILSFCFYCFESRSQMNYETP